MSFRPEVEHIESIISVSESRERMNLRELDVEGLMVRTGSISASVAKEAQDELYRRWELRPEFDVQKAERVDLREKFKQFTPEQLKLISENITSIQLTHGCNGNCYYCVFGKKDQVDSKFSFESVKWYLETYGRSAIQLAFYWDSDPFDYRDGDKTFLDVYNVYRNVEPKKLMFITTSIPKGGQDDFTKFAKYLADNEADNTTIRISTNVHNIQRIEVTLKRLAQELLDSGKSEDEVNTFFKKKIDVLYMNENSLEPVGRLAEQMDPYKPTHTPVCVDGVTLNPKHFNAIVTTAPTPYRSAGQELIEITPANAELVIPQVLYATDYQGWFSPKQWEPNWRLSPTHSMLPRVLLADKPTHLTMENPLDNTVLQLGREIYSHNHLLTDISRLEAAPTNRGATFEQKQSFLKTAIVQFKKREISTEVSIENAKYLLATGVLTEEEREELEYYILYANATLLRMDCVANIGAKDAGSMKTAIAVATTLKEIGKEHIDILPKVVAEIANIANTLKDKMDSETIVALIVERIGPLISDFDGIEYSPRWFKYLVGGMVGANRTA